MPHIDSGPLQASPDDSGRISDFFPGQKNVFFCGLQTIKIPIAETDFIQTYTNSIRGFEPFGFDNCMHYLRHPIDEFLSRFHGTRVPNTCQSVFPHDHCSSLVAVFSLLSTSCCANSKSSANSVSQGWQS